jgi:hypothetical protein
VSSLLMCEWGMLWPRRCRPPPRLNAVSFFGHQTQRGPKKTQKRSSFLPQIARFLGENMIQQSDESETCFKIVFVSQNYEQEDRNLCIFKLSGCCYQKWASWGSIPDCFTNAHPSNPPVIVMALLFDIYHCRMMMLCLMCACGWVICRMA